MKTSLSVWVVGGVLAFSHFGFIPADAIEAPAASIQPVWTQNQEIETPESAVYDARKGWVYVSSIAGEGTAKDARGWVQAYDAASGALRPFKVSGLHAPKGMRIHEDTLWVSDIDSVVAISLKSAKIKRRVKIPGAKFLNDLAIASDGRVFVSDTVLSKIYVVEKGKVRVFESGEELEHPNGLLIEGGKLWVAGWGKGFKPDFSTETDGRLFSIDLQTRKKEFFTASPTGHLDGLERSEGGGFWATDWSKGTVMRIDSAGTSRTVLRGFKGAADLALTSTADAPAGTGLVIIPIMGENRVVAYSAKDLGL
jgi:sugar lactone lactonase YvrE